MVIVVRITEVSDQVPDVDRSLGFVPPDQGRVIIEELSDEELEDEDLVGYGKPDSDEEDSSSNSSSLNSSMMNPCWGSLGARF